MSRGIGARRRVSNWRPTGPPLPRPLSPAAREKGENSISSWQAADWLAGGPSPGLSPLVPRGEGRIRSRSGYFVGRVTLPRAVCGRRPGRGARRTQRDPNRITRIPALQSAQADFANFQRRIHSLCEVGESCEPGGGAPPAQRISAEPPRSAQKALPPIRMIGGRAPGMRKGAGALYSTTAAEGSTPAASASTTTAVSAVAAAAAAAAATRARSFSTSSTTRRGSMGLAR